MTSDKIEIGAPSAAALEAILFAAGEYVEKDAIMAALGISASKLEDLAAELSKNCESRGIKLLELDGAYQLSTRSEYYDYIRKATEQTRGQGLSHAAMEVLAIVAYKQPVTKSQIDTIRGVDSTSPLGRLTATGLVEAVGKLDAPGRPTLYATTRVFLRTFGLTDLSNLPDIGTFEALETTSQLVMDLNEEENTD